MAAITNPYLDSWNGFKTTVEKAKERFDILGIQGQENKEKLHRILEVAYKQLHFICRKEGALSEELSSHAGDLFYLYGLTICESNPKAGRSIFLLSLNVQMGITKPYKPIKTLSECSVLEWLPLNLTRKAANDQIELTSKCIEYLPDIEFQNIVQSSKAILIAKTIRHIFQCCKNLDHFIPTVDQNISRLERISRTCKKVLKTLDPKNSEVNWEKAQLLFHTWCSTPCLHKPKDTAQYLRKLSHIEKLLNRENYSLRAQYLRAEIAMLKSQATEKLIEERESHKEKLGILWSSVCYCQRAYDIANYTDFFDPSLKNKYLNCLLRLCLRSSDICRDRKLCFSEQASNLISYVKTVQVEAIHATYALTAAKCFFYIGKGQRALDSLEEATKICIKYPKETEEVAVEVEQYKNLINKI